MKEKTKPEPTVEPESEIETVDVPGDEPKMRQGKMPLPANGVVQSIRSQ